MVIGRRVGRQTIQFAPEDRGSATFTRLGDRLATEFQNVADVACVQADHVVVAEHSQSERNQTLRRCADAVSIVLDDEDDWQTLLQREAHRFVEFALPGRGIAQGAQDDGCRWFSSLFVATRTRQRTLCQEPDAPGVPRCGQALGPCGRRNGEHGGLPTGNVGREVTPLRAGTGAGEVVHGELLCAHAPRQHEGTIPVVGEQAIFGPQVKRKTRERLVPRR